MICILRIRILNEQVTGVSFGGLLYGVYKHDKLTENKLREKMHLQS